MTIVCPEVLELWRLLRWYQGISTGEQWNGMYIGMSVAAKHLPKSMRLGMPGTGSTWPGSHCDSHANTSQWTSSRTCYRHKHLAKPGSALLWSDWQRRQSTYSPGKMLTRRNRPWSSLNTWSACAASWTTLLPIASSSFQAAWGPRYVLTWVLTLSSWQPSILRWTGRQSVKIRQASSIPRLSTTTSMTIQSNCCWEPNSLTITRYTRLQW